MNEYDIKAVVLATLFSGVALLVTVWGYHLAYRIPLLITNMLSGVVSGVTVLVVLICYLKLRDMRNFIEEDEDGKIQRP